MVFAVGGVAFPIGVLIYWTTTNLWTMGQQFYVIRRNPAPARPAFDAKVERDRAKGRTTELSQELAVEGRTATSPPPSRSASGSSPRSSRGSSGRSAAARSRRTATPRQADRPCARDRDEDATPIRRKERMSETPEPMTEPTDERPSH